MSETGTHPTAGAKSIGTRTHALGALGGNIRGYELGVVAGALLYAGPALHLGAFLTGWVVSSALMGAVIGALGSGPLADRFGRRAMIAGAGALYAVGIIGAALSQNAAMLISARVLLGFGVGVATAMIPLYIGELAPARSRGASASLFQLMITTGVLSASIASYVLSFSGAWRWMFAIGAFPALAMLVGAWFLPESPRWLIRTGREAEARDILARSADAGTVDERVAAIRRVNEQARHRLDIRTALAHAELRRLVIVGSGLGILQQFIGINAVTYYAPTVLKSIGYSSQAAIAANIGFSSLALVGTACMVLFVVDRIGRRVPLMAGALAMGASMAVLGVVFAISSTASGAGGWIAIVALAAFQLAFALSWGGIVWTVLGEMYPLRIRGAAMGFATAWTEGASVGISFLFPDLLKTSPALVFFVFAAMGLVAFLWTAFLLPETSHRSLEELEDGLLAPGGATVASARAVRGELAG